jgi:DNA-binding NarL/FixJ family response regulator
MGQVRATRIIYVENDPALRKILSKLLAQENGIEVVASVGSATEALQLPNLKHIDAALIDYSLGQDSLNGLELGMALRAFNEHLGILIYSQFEIKNISKRIPASHNHGWGFATKSGNADISELAANLISVASGKNLPMPSESRSDVTSESRLNRYARLSERQRATMALAAQGLNPKAIGEQLGISYDLARQELSRSYKILVPQMRDEQVLNVTAILEFTAARKELSGDYETPS